MPSNSHPLNSILQPRDNVVKGSLLTFDTGSSERGEKSFVIEVVAEDWFTVIAPIHNVIDRVGILDAQRTQHGPTLPNIRVSVNSKERPEWRLDRAGS